MLVAVIGFSAIPVYIAVADTHRAPFVFTAFLYAGQFVGLGAYTLLSISGAVLPGGVRWA